MMRPVATLVAVALAVAPLRPGTAAGSQPAPFPEVSLEAPPARSHLWAYLSIAAGAGLIAGSFDLASRANRSYEAYLVASTPDEITRLYDRTVRYDRLSSGALLAGELLVAAGLYFRFLRRTPGSRTTLALDARRCAVTWRF